MSTSIGYDIVVIGAGLAGLSAVLESGRSQPDLKICLLEKQDRIGGNSAKASSGINAISSELDRNDFIHDTLLSGRDRSSRELVEVLVNQSESALKFLEDEHVDLSVRSQLGGHSQSRTRRNRSGPNIGFAIISALQIAVQKLGDRIDIKTSCPVISISQSADHHIITYHHHNERHQIQARALILTTGGFAANPALLAQYRPEIANLPTTNGLYANGDGIQLALAGGYHAGLVDMDQIQIHPTGFVDPADRSNGHKILAPEALRGSGGILVDHHGQRFVNELTTRDIVSSAVASAPESHAFLILDQTAAQIFGFGTLQFYVKRGLVRKCSSTAEIAEFIALNGDASSDALTDTINAYRHAAAHKQDQFGKTLFPSDFHEGDYYVMEVVPVLHYCMGGLKFDANANVLDENNKPISGLYAAGEVTGGLHGANRLAGNSLLECVVFGRIASRSALAYIANSS